MRSLRPPPSFSRRSVASAGAWFAAARWMRTRLPTPCFMLSAPVRSGESAWRRRAIELDDHQLPLSILTVGYVRHFLNAHGRRPQVVAATLADALAILRPEPLGGHDLDGHRAIDGLNDLELAHKVGHLGEDDVEENSLDERAVRATQRLRHPSVDTV